MTLYTKSIKQKPNSKDGIRICIMRHPSEDLKHDIWMPQLSPSQKLRADVKKGIGWEKFKVRFLNEMKKQNKFLKFIANSAEKSDLTLLCIEDNPNFCHRSLAASIIKKINPKLKVVIR